MSTDLLRVKTCAKCGKEFAVQRSHRYKRKRCYYCSWSCFNGHVVPDIKDHPGFVPPKPRNRPKHSEVKTKMELNGALACKLLDEGHTAEEIAEKYGMKKQGVAVMAGLHRKKMEADPDTKSNKDIVEAMAKPRKGVVDELIESILTTESERPSALDQKSEAATQAKLIFHKRIKTNSQAHRPQVRVSRKAYDLIESIRQHSGMTGADIVDMLVEYVEPNIVLEEATN